MTIGAIGVLTLADEIELWHVVVLVVLYGVGQALFQPSFAVSSRGGAARGCLHASPLP